MKDKRDYKRCFNLVMETINRHDPVGLMASGCPSDEYSLEVPGVLKAVCTATSQTMLEERVREVFAHWFGDDIAGQFGGWPAFCEDLWTNVKPACE